MKKILVLIFCLWSSVAFGTDIYIDPSCLHNGDGTAQSCASTDGGTGAYNTAPSNWVITEDNTHVYWRRGTIDDWSLKHDITHQRIIADGDGLIFGAYGSGSDPIIINYYDYQSSPPACTLHDTNIWFCATDSSYAANAPFILGLGTDWVPGKQRQYHNGSATQPLDEWGEWDYQNLSGENPNGFYIYSPSSTNPFTYYGEIHFQTAQNTTIRLRNVTNAKVQDIKFCKHYVGVYIASNSAAISNVNVSSCSFKQSFYGVKVAGTDARQSDTVIIASNVLTNILAVPIYFNGVVGNSQVYNNYLVHNGYSRSVGGVYWSNHYSTKLNPGIEIFNNYCTDYHYGEYWPDGSCYYLDEGASHSKVHHNIATDTARAYMDHSSENNTFYYNIGVHVGQGMRLSAKNTGSGDTVTVYNNSFVDCGNFPDFVPGSLDHTRQCVRASRNYDDIYIIKNNLLTADNSAVGGLAVDSNVQDQVISDSSNNLIFGFEHPGHSTTTSQEVDLTGHAIFNNPLLSGYHITRQSPARNAGTIIQDLHKSWPDWAKDIDGDSIIDVPDIGADEFRIKPNIGGSRMIVEEVQ